MINKTRRGFAKLHGAESTETIHPAFTLDAVTIWKDNNPNTGVFTKSEIITFIKSLRTQDYDELEKLFEFLTDKRRVSGPLKYRTDKGGNPYLWLAFSRPMANDGVKVVVNDEVVELIHKYIEGIVFIDFNIDDLIDQGLS